MSDQNSVVAVFTSHENAEAAVRELQQGGFDMKKLSIVGKDYHTEEHVVGYYTTGDRMLYWGKLGAFWGGFWGLLLGSAFFWVPGIGQLIVAGPLVMWIVGALEEAAVVGGLRRSRRTVQHRHSEEERLAIRDRSQERQTPPGRPRDARGSRTCQGYPASDKGADNAVHAPQTSCPPRRPATSTAEWVHAFRGVTSWRTKQRAGFELRLLELRNRL